MTISNPSTLQPNLSYEHQKAIKNAKVSGKRKINDIAGKFEVNRKTVRKIKNGENENRHKSLAEITMEKIQDISNWHFLTVTQLARDCGVSRGTVYNAIGKILDKQDILAQEIWVPSNG